MLTEKTKVKDFSLKDQNNNIFKLSDHLGKKVIIYFYPQDDTPGCTLQAQEFKKEYQAFKEHGFLVVGISPDSIESHQCFIKNHGLPFTLLSDPSKEVMKYFGAYGEKNLYGRKTIGVIRSTFIIDETGHIEKVYKRAIPAKNATQILKYLLQ